MQKIIFVIFFIATFTALTIIDTTALALPIKHIFEVSQLQSGKIVREIKLTIADKKCVGQQTLPSELRPHAVPLIISSAQCESLSKMLLSKLPQLKLDQKRELVANRESQVVAQLKVDGVEYLTLPGVLQSCNQDHTHCEPEKIFAADEISDLILSLSF